LSNQSPTVFPTKKLASQRYHNLAAAAEHERERLQGIPARPVPNAVALLARRPTLKVAAIALANKLARMAWAIMAKEER